MTTRAIEPEYKAEGSFLLVGAPSSSGASIVDASTLVQVLGTPQARERLVARGAAAPYLVELTPGSNGLVRIVAVGPDGQENVRTVRAVLDALPDELDAVQESAEVPPSALATVRTITSPEGSVTVGPDGVPRAEATALVIPSQTSSSNPLAPSLFTTRVIEEQMLGPDGFARVADIVGGEPARYSVTFKPRDVAPILLVSATGEDPDVTYRTYLAVGQAIDQLLQEGQDAAGVAANAGRTTIAGLATPTGASTSPGTKVRVAVAIVGLGLAVAVTLAMVVESVAERRRRARAVRRLHRDRADDPVAFGAPTATTAGESTSKASDSAPAMSSGDLRLKTDRVIRLDLPDDRLRRS